LAEEREKDGHGVFTKALIDCLCEPLKERITVDDWYDFAFNRLKISGNQTPRIRNSREGDAIEIGNFKKKLDRLAGQEREQLILKAREKLNNLVSAEVLHEKEVEWWVHLLELGENLSLRNRQSRDDLIRYLKGEIDPWRVFGRVREIDDRPPPPEPEPPKQGEVRYLKGEIDPWRVFGRMHEIDDHPPPPGPEPPGPERPAAPWRPPIADPPISPESSINCPPVAPSTSEVLPGTGGGAELSEAKKPIQSLMPTKAHFIPAVFAIGVMALAVYFFAPSVKSVRVADNEKQVSPSATHEDPGKIVTASPAINAPAPSETAQIYAPSPVVKAFGMELSSLSDETRKKFGITNAVKYGVVATNVDLGSAADVKHIQTGFVITEINRERVNDPTDVAKIMQALKSRGIRSAFVVVVNAQGDWRNVDLALEDNEKQATLPVTEGDSGKSVTASPDSRAATPKAIASPDDMAKKAKSKECSAKADAQGLHGKARVAFRETCKLAVAVPVTLPAITLAPVNPLKPAPIAALIESKKVKTVSVRPDGTLVPNDTPPKVAAPSTAVFPSAISPTYAVEDPYKARLKTCSDQYKTNMATNTNGGLKWIQKGGGYYSECTKRLKSTSTR
jgi:hypothetical protein